MDIFASIASASGDYVGKYSVGSQSILINAANSATVSSLTNLVADSTGNLVLDVTVGDANTSRAVLNTLSVTMVPEPPARSCRRWLWQA